MRRTSAGQTVHLTWITFNSFHKLLAPSSSSPLRSVASSPVALPPVSELFRVYHFISPTRSLTERLMESHHGLLVQ
ncbi:hypothetical protein VZT92_000021 [Zoarces viviparus]|uniref:Uncharacterized protein n=1 Tax=Zoarces viviparus TaxID=48416 RepID=A0AAW1G5H3_ZOAVI